jgi:arsenate reductase
VTTPSKIRSAKPRVLFVCIGNSCRSQMAEGFARAYGSDVMIAASAGLSPAFIVAPDTMRAMEEKNIDLRDQDIEAPVRHWDILDPIGENFETHCKIRDQIETRVMELIIELRRGV